MMQQVKRLWALIICVVMVWNMFPHQVLAVEMSEDTQKQVKELRFYADCESDEYVLVGGKEKLEFNTSGNPYRFEIEFVDPDLIGYAFISSTIKNEKAVLDAHYDEDKDLFVTEGYFEPGGKDYIPKNIRVEYTMKTYAPAVGSDVDWDEMTGLLSEELRNSTVNNVTTGENSSGSVMFSDGVKGLGDVTMDYAINSVVDSTALGQIRNEYQSAEKVLSYVVPGLDDSRYQAYLDMSDPNTLKMMIDDGLDTGGKAIEMTMTFLDESNLDEQTLREVSESLSNVGTAVGVVGDMYNIHREMDGLRDEVASAGYITDKETALTAIDNLEADQIAFALVVTMIPIIASGGMASGPAAVMFTSIIGVMSAASDTVYKQRIATIMEKPTVSQASWGDFSLYGGAPGGFVWELYPEYSTLRFRYNASSGGTGILSSSSSLNNYDHHDNVKDMVYRIVIEDGAVGLSEKAISEFDALEELELPHSLRTIAYQSIYVCNALEEIDIPEGVTNISSGAFYLCGNLKRISLPVSVKKIGTIASNCPQLTDVYYAGNADQWEQIFGHVWMEDKAFTVHLKYPGGTLGNGFSWYFDQQTGTLTITGSGDMPRLPQEDIFSDVTHPWHFFDGKITRVVLSEGITSIPVQAFRDHKELIEVVLPKSLKSIDENVFENCTSLTKIILPESLESIDCHAFENCTSLTKITLPESLEYIGEYAFAGSGLTEIKVPKTVDHVGQYQFSGCTDLKTATIDALVEEVPIGCFENCTSLTSFAIADTVTSISAQAFSGCTALKHVTIPEQIRTIVFDAFKDCTGIESVTISARLEELQAAFPGCTKLKDIYYGSSQAAWNALDSNGTMVEPVLSATKHYTSAGYCGENIAWDFQEETGILYISGSGEMNDYGPEYYTDAPWHDYLDDITSIKMEGSITSIGDYAFYGLKNIANISIPDTVTSIGLCAFDEVGLEEVKLPKNLTSVGASAFARNKMKEIVIPDSVTSVEYSAFAECENLESVTIGTGLSKIGNGMFREDSALKNITIPNNVAIIGQSAFQGAGLTSIVIPEGVTTVEYGAFAWCRDLQTIRFAPSVSSLEDLAFYMCTGLNKLYFTGNAPAFGENTFEEVNATAYFPGDNNTWTADIRQNYGGKITWEVDAPSCSHVEVVIPGKAATCTESGLTEGKYCSACGETILAQKVIPAGHDYENYVCAVCGHIGLDAIRDNISQGTPSQIRTAVQKIPTNTLKNAMTEDTNNVGVVTELAALENEVGGQVEVIVGEQFKEFARNKISIVGANLNTPAGSGNIKLLVDLPEKENAIPEGIDSAIAVHFSMTLENVKDPRNLDVPVKITIPVPAGMNPETLVVIHYHGNGTEILKPTVYEENATLYASFVLDKFCDFAISEIKEDSCAAGHNWQSATCTAPKKCKTCGVTEGNALGHSWKNATCTTAKTCKTCGATSGNALGHSWKDATCTAPKTCKTCGATSGNALGHNWKDATCTAPKTCKTCGATSGKAKGHDWAAGNCTTPKTCKVCGAKDGGVVHAYEHKYDYKCDLCGTTRPVDMTRPMVDMFRMYDPNSGEHFYTGSMEERENLVAVGWQYEGVGFTFPLTTGKPVHRLYDPITGEHLYTMDENEMNMLLDQGWNYEGIAFNSGFENEVPQYRLHNPNATRGAYHFTASIEERDFLISVGWEYQGIGWYSLGA